MGENEMSNWGRRLWSASVSPNSNAPAPTRPGRHAPKMTSATAIHPRPGDHPDVPRTDHPGGREVGAGHARHRPAGHHRSHAEQQHGVSGGVGGRGVLPRRPEAEAEPGPAQHEPRADAEGNGHVGNRCATEDDLAHPRDVGQAGDLPVGEPRSARIVGVAVADVVGQAQTEDRERQSGHDLVGPHSHRGDGVHQRQPGPGRGAAEQSDPGTARLDTDDEAHHGTHRHHPLDAEVEDPCPLGDGLAERREVEQHTELHRGDEEADQRVLGEREAENHALTTFRSTNFSW